MIVTPPTHSPQLTLQKILTKWDAKCDLRLRRLVAYIWSSLDKRLVGYVSKKSNESGLHLYTDADLGGCPDTQRSTTGVFLCIKGPDTMFPLVAISKRQSCASISTPEAELVAAQVFCDNTEHRTGYLSPGLADARVQTWGRG